MLPIIYQRRLTGRNATNNSWRVVIDPTAPFWRAVLAQEIWESRHKLGSLWRPLRLFRRIFRRTEFKQDLELRGHEVEVQAAVQFFSGRETDHRKREARGMVEHYPQFRGWSVARVEIAMEQRADAARKWVREHREELLGYEREG